MLILTDIILVLFLNIHC